MLRRFIIGAVVVLGLCAGAIYLFWPAEWAVRGPVVSALFGFSREPVAASVIDERLRAPAGLHVSVFARGLKTPRMMAFTPAGNMVVSEARAGSVVLLRPDEDGDGFSDALITLLSGMDMPHGLVVTGGSEGTDPLLYVATQSDIRRYSLDEAAGTLSGETVIFSGMPTGGNHRTRTLGLGPDGRLYVTVGSSCNVCLESEPYRAEMLTMLPDGSDARSYAIGLRNTVGFDWQLATGDLFGTDNGRDLLGENTPNDELNRIIDGGDYGWPYSYDNRVPDPDFGAGAAERIAASNVMVHGFGAHRAPLGMRFLKHQPEASGLNGKALVALHGSWNRRALAGYKVVALSMPEGGSGAIAESDFLTGFEQDEDVIGRPVDVVESTGGDIFVSDDYAGTVYRISRTAYDQSRASVATGKGAGVTDTSSPTKAERGTGVADVGTVTAGEPTIEELLAGLSEAEVAKQTSLGVLLFATSGCSACHLPGAALEGVAVKELRGLSKRYTLESLKAFLANPPAPMPNFNYSDKELQALAVYLLVADSGSLGAGPQPPNPLDVLSKPGGTGEE